MRYPHKRLTDVWEMLQKTEGNALLSAMNSLFKLAAQYRDCASMYKTQEMKKILEAALDRVTEEMAKLELDKELGVMEFADKTLLALYVLDIDSADKQGMANEIYSLVKSLDMAIEGSLRGRTMYYMDPRNAERYEKAKLEFSQEVIHTFPNACWDLEEAVKCLAFERYTACVFHLARPMEIAVRKVGKRMGVTVKYKKEKGYLHWGTITNNMNGRLAILKRSDPDEYEKWVRVHGMLECVRVAWRNETMHPGTKYSEKEAEEVLDAVKTFLDCLAKQIA